MQLGRIGVYPQPNAAVRELPLCFHPGIAQDTIGKEDVEKPLPVRDRVYVRAPRQDVGGEVALRGFLLATQSDFYRISLVPALENANFQIGKVLFYHPVILLNFSDWLGSHSAASSTAWHNYPEDTALISGKWWASGSSPVWA